MSLHSTTIAHWHFVPKLEDPTVCRRWIQVSQQNGLLLPGESINITLTVRVDKKTAQALHLGRELLEDVLILRIENSGDDYGPASSFCASCIPTYDEYIPICDLSTHVSPMW